MEAIARKLGRSQSDAMRFMMQHFAAALGVRSNLVGTPIISVVVERVAELEY